QVPEHGAVWYPRTVPENWAPYRQGRWVDVAPWGWTWVDEAPWGFAPFHYGRWAQINNRWAWVPGRLAPRPAYSPALVVFAGGGNLVVRGGPGVAWYPLAPGEVWWPAFRASPRYFGRVNFGFNLRAYPRGYTNYYWARRPFAVTAVQIGDFRLGRPVYRAWAPVNAQVIARARIGFAPAALTRVELRAVRGTAVVRLQARPASVRTVGGARIAERRKQEIRAAGGGRDNDRAAARPGARGADNDRAAARPAARGADNDRAGGRRGDDNDRAGGRPNPRGNDNDRAGGRRGDDNDRAGGRPSPRGNDNDRGARQGAREDRPGRGPEAREERGGGRGPEPRAERQERVQQQRPERAEAPRQQQRAEREQPQRQQRAEREQPQREQRGGGGGGRGRDRDEDERGGRR
ncbi:DUF6600 domain-containing protein, partial [Ramlibacter sp.]|uniref:DUF6600 domain-containing protein n=1 Tax=Ramlibacter sp. TaxID=1917967 RepID=UPI002FCB2B5B